MKSNMKTINLSQKQRERIESDLRFYNTLTTFKSVYVFRYPRVTRYIYPECFLNDI